MHRCVFSNILECYKSHSNTLRNVLNYTPTLIVLALFGGVELRFTQMLITSVGLIYTKYVAGSHSTVVRAAGTKSRGHNFESHMGFDGDFSATGPNKGEFATSSMGKSIH